MIARRRIVIGLGTSAALAPFSLFPQQRTRPARIAILTSESATDAREQSVLAALREGLRSLGYVEGNNLLIEHRSAEGKYDRLAALATEIVRNKPDIVVTFGIKAALAAKAATLVIPIVLPGTASDVVALGLASSLRHPGGNFTGSASFGPELLVKRLELLKEVLPRMTRVGMLSNPANPGLAPTLAALTAGAKSLNIAVQIFDLPEAAQIEQVVDAIARARFDAAAIVSDTLIVSNHRAIANAMLRKSLPCAGPRPFGEAGGLLGYGADTTEMHRRAAIYIDKILKGTKAGDLPIEQPTKFELVVNLKTAKALGLTMPPAIMVRADRVIE